MFFLQAGLFGLVAISLPRIGRIFRVTYERWLFLHRLPGLFVVLGVTHGLLVDLVIGSSVTLQVVYLAVGTLGVVPFLNWLTSLKPDDHYGIDLFYSVPTEADAVYLPEVTSLSSRLPFVRVHHVFTRSEGHLTANDVVDALHVPLRDVHVFLCGPPAMVQDISNGLRKRGVPRDYVHAENFAFR